MNENQPTSRYSYRTSNLMHHYYAVNSIDGRKPMVTQKSNSFWSSTIGIGVKFIQNGLWFFKQVFKLKITRFGLFEPKLGISLTPNYLIVKPILIPYKETAANFDRKRKMCHHYNTKNK